ncbi:hypothetical protein M8J76_006996 [Diaphorina citri]|nr:hypothetical protein M8J76_007985 [Diaphorina citri]KAI5740769.1 hypothetical protein M8J76_006996 [Diaphorina citri]
MGATRRSEWICLRCRKTNPPADGNISDEDEEEETGQDVGKMLKEMAKKWDGFEKKLTFQTCQLRHQAFKRVKVNTVRYGNRRLEYCVPRLLNDFCQDFLEETNRYRVKQKLKESLVAKRCLHD